MTATGGDAGATATGGTSDAGGSGGVSSIGGAGGSATGGATATGGSGGTTSAPPTTVVDGPTGHAFDTAKGVLNVDYAAYLPKHDLVYAKPNTNSLYGLTVGNGRTGAMVWSENGLSMQVSNVDISEQSAYAGGLVAFNTNPAIDSGGGAFQQRLALYDGVVSTKYGSEASKDARTVTVIGAPNSEVIGIHVVDGRAGVTSATVDLSLWDLSTLSNWNVRNLDTWKKVTTYAEADSAGLSRGQADPDEFGYTLAATVEGAAFTTSSPSASAVRLTITPSASYTIWIACSSRLNAAGNDSVGEAKAALARTKQATYATTFAGYEDFWHAFWRRSFVQYSNAAGDADYLENVYFLATEMIAAGGFGNYPFHFINGVERATADKTKWSNGYWYWNQRDVYNSFLASNHADVMAPFNKLYSRNVPALEAFTKSRFGFDGLWVPETMGWNGNADGNTEYTNDIFTTATEAAMNMYAQFAYTGDADYLKNTAYPFMRDVAKFYVKKLTKDAGSGKYVMLSSNAHETYWHVKNALTDLAAVRQLFPVAIKTSQSLGVDADLRPQWQDVLDNLTPYPNDGTKYLPHEPPISQTRNNENIVGELLWPYDVTGIDAPDYAMALASWKARPFPYGNVWSNDAIQAARLGLGDDANAGMKTMLKNYQSYPNGMTNNTNGVFEYLGVHLCVMNESLLQSYDGRIRVFPALPKDTGLVTRFTLAARGGFLVTSEREGGDIKYVGLLSQLGGSATVINPWGATAVKVRKIVGAGATATSTDVTSSSSVTLTFDTQKGGVYVVERASKPLDGFTWSVVTGTPNQGVKKLGTTNTLGIAGP